MLLSLVFVILVLNRLSPPLVDVIDPTRFQTHLMIVPRYICIRVYTIKSLQCILLEQVMVLCSLSSCTQANQIYSWFTKYLHLTWHLWALASTSTQPSGDVGRCKQAFLVPLPGMDSMSILGDRATKCQQ